MLQKLHKYFHTIRARILLSTISFIVFISVAITFISYFVVSANLQKNLIRTSETRLSFLCSSIDTNLNGVRGFIRSCQISSKILKFVMEEDTGNNKVKREARDYIMDAYSSNQALSSQLIRMVVIGKSRNDIVQVVETSYSTVAVSSDAIFSLPYYETLLEHPGEVATDIMQDPFFTTRNVPMIPSLHLIDHPYQAGETGYIFTEMSTSVITDPIRNYTTETDNQLFFRLGDSLYEYKNDMLVPCSREPELIKDMSENALSSDTFIQKAHLADEKRSSILISRPLNNEGWYVTEALDQHKLSQDILKTFMLIVAIILTASTLIGILLFHYLSRAISVPVKQLQERMKRIAGGDFSRDASTEWDHELGDIGKNINDLSENVLLLMNRQIEDERQKKDYEYRMLQSQINPHFLYNTLNSIKWMATIQNVPGIAEMTTSLSRLLKDIAKGSSSLVTIGHELSLIKDYFTIQQYRYGGIITLTVEIEDPALTDCQILKFTLQPIVENSIFHGIEPKGSAGMIRIHIYQDKNTDVHIDIVDDGVGMSPETAAHLLDAESPAGSSFFREIGISNVHKRLQYEFGTEYGLSVMSEQGAFTTISILLPYRRGEKENDESTDCR